MFTLALLMLAQPVDCPPIGTAARDRAKAAGDVCKDEPPPKPRVPYAPRPISAADKAAIIAAADKVLFDGPSARWEWGVRRNADLYCGMVNAKNRMGGYVGWTPFYFFQGEVRVIGPSDSRIVYEALCSSAGYINTDGV